MVRFTATVQLRGANPFVDVPTTAAAELLPLAEHGRIRVTGTLRGTEFNATVMPGRSGRHVLYLSGGLRTATGVHVGETVTVDVLALNADEFIPPGDLAAALDAAVGAADKWGQLPVSQRRELTRFLEDARTPSTRARRVEQLVAQVLGADVPPPGRRTGRALWTCPSCGRQFVTRNMNHSCSQHTLDEPFRDRPESIHRLFELVRRTVEAIGPVKLFRTGTVSPLWFGSGSPGSNLRTSGSMWSSGSRAGLSRPDSEGSKHWPRTRISTRCG